MWVRDHTCSEEIVGVCVASPSSETVLFALILFQEDHGHPIPTMIRSSNIYVATKKSLRDVEFMDLAVNTKP